MVAKMQYNRRMEGCIILLMILMFIPSAYGYTWLFDTNEEFIQGNLVNTEAYSNTIRLSSDIKVYKYLWVANSGESSISKVNTERNREVARYWTGTGGGTSYQWVSRTAVDAEGNVWVGNRVGDKTVVKIASHPSYCVDRDNNGMIETSYDANDDGRISTNEMLPWGQDECVILSVGPWEKTSDAGPRALAIDLNGYVWVGLWDLKTFVKLDPNNGAPVASVPIPGHPYGAAMDNKGFLWSSNRGGGTVSKIDTHTNTEVGTYIPASRDLYGIAADKHGRVWLADYANGGLIEVNANDPTQSVVHTVPAGGRGVTVDSDGNVWYANSATNTVYKYLPGSTSYPSSGTWGCQVGVSGGPIGVVMDADRYIWAISADGYVTKINPSDCSIIAQVPVGVAPYTYSDATGSLLYQFIKEGFWTVTLQNPIGNNVWRRVTWAESNNQGDNIIVEKKSLGESSFTRVVNGQEFNSVTQGLVLKVILKRNPDGSPPTLVSISVDASGIKCPSGTTMCSDGRCRKKCFVCGEGIVDSGEECDKNNPATTTCPDGCTGGPVTCKADCTWDTSSCSCPQCDPTKTDNYCCVIPEDNKCDSECTSNADSDCKDKCTSYAGDCCEDKKDGTCDYDCIAYKDPDCSTSCTSEKDDCCNAGSDGKCDSDCDYNPDTKVFIDPDCKTKFPDGCTNSQGDCCNNNKDDICDTDCITGVDTDCKCSNGIIDTGETCDTTNLDTKTCNSFFPGYGGLLTCFSTDGEHPCHFDTSGCHKIPEVCTGGSCSFLKDCRCPECVGKQSTCSYGAVCDATARCACIEGTTLCKDSTCRSVQNCKDYDGGEQLCIGTANGICDVGEGCGCSDCEGKKGPCNALSVCQDSVCTGCFLKSDYWSNIRTGQAEECIGSGNEIKMTVEGTPGCEDKTVTFKIAGISQGGAVFKNGKAELVWKADPQGSYQFEASLEGGDDKILSKKLEVEYCIKECDDDCDEICETKQCVTDNPTYCKNDVQEGEVTLDVNTMTGYCEECDKYGLSKGQDTCAAYYDCTPGWWGDDTNYNGAGTAAEARTVLEWGDCGNPKIIPYPTDWNRQKVSGNMRNRLVCPEKDSSGNTILKNQCCANQASCYCELPKESDMNKKGLNCNLPEFRPTEIKACLSEEKFPFFTTLNVLIVISLLVVFYLFRFRRD